MAARIFRFETSRLPLRAKQRLDLAFERLVSATRVPQKLVPILRRTRQNGLVIDLIP